MEKKSSGRTWGALARLIALLVAVAGVAASTDAENFIDQRRGFRKQISNKVETKLDQEGDYLAIIFKGEEDKYKFNVTAPDKDRIKKYAREYYGQADEALLEKIALELNQGRYVVFKKYEDEGVSLKTIFLSPTAKYWDWLTDANGIEKLFHTYNFSVGLYAPNPDSMFTVLQTEGSFFGITQAVSLPLLFTRDAAQKTFVCRMPTQAEITDAVAKMAPVKPGRTKPDEKFIDACRTHPYFQQMKDGKYVVSDEEIMKIYNTTVLNLADCPVKATDAVWKIQEDFPYLVVSYTLKTKVNIQAFIPPSMKALAGALGKVAQDISDEVSVKYLPLSMKNFRDLTQEWTKSGGPK